MKIDPRYSFWFGVWTTVLLLIASAAFDLTHMVPAEWIPAVKAWAAGLGAINSAILTALHGYSGPTSGPLAAPPTMVEARQVMTEAQAALKALLVVVASSLVLALLVGDARAQDRAQDRTRTSAQTPAARSVPCIDVLNQIPPGCTPGQNPITNIVTTLEGLLDTADAITLSTQIPSIQDPVGSACWKSFDGLSQVIKAHPLPATLKIAADLEAARLAAIALNQICTNPNCGQMWTDVTNTVSALNILPLPFSLQSVCSKIPAIGVFAAPATTPVQPTPAQLGTETK